MRRRRALPRIHHSCRSHTGRAGTPFWGYAELASRRLAMLAPRRPFTSSRTPTAGKASIAISGLTPSGCFPTNDLQKLFHGSARGWVVGERSTPSWPPSATGVSPVRRMGDTLVAPAAWEPPPPKKFWNRLEATVAISWEIAQRALRAGAGLLAEKSGILDHTRALPNKYPHAPRWDKKLGRFRPFPPRRR